MKVFQWISGRQHGVDYFKFPFFLFKLWKFGMDGYILHYLPNTTLPPHKDPIKGKHYRLNIELKGHGEFICERTIFSWFGRIHFFRPDLYTHSVVNGKKDRYVLSIGLALFS